MDPVDEVLQHFGVRGMKWGVRRESGGSASSRSAASKGAISNKMLKHHKAVATSMGPSISAINNKAKYKNIDLNKNRTLKKEYHNDLANAFTARSAKVAGKSVPQYQADERKRKIRKGVAIAAVTTVIGVRVGMAVLRGYPNLFDATTTATVVGGTPKPWSSRPGTLGENPRFAELLKTAELTGRLPHSDSDENELYHADDLFVAYFDVDETGHAISCHVANDEEIEHSMDPVDDVLAHFGVRGMRWGVRRERTGGSSSGPTEVVVKAKPGKLVKTSGGARHPASEDALEAARNRQKAKLSSTDSLSNKELQAVIQRMNLEQQFSNLKRKDTRGSIGKKFIQSFFKNPNKSVEEISKFANGPAGKAIKKRMAAKKVAQAAAKLAT